jgi:hypothetical protein
MGLSYMKEKEPFHKLRGNIPYPQFNNLNLAYNLLLYINEGTNMSTELNSDLFPDFFKAKKKESRYRAFKYYLDGIVYLGLVKKGWIDTSIWKYEITGIGKRLIETKDFNIVFNNIPSVMTLFALFKEGANKAQLREVFDYYDIPMPSIATRDRRIQGILSWQKTLPDKLYRLARYPLGENLDLDMLIGRIYGNELVHNFKEKYKEGADKLIRHLSHERNPKAVKAKKAQFRSENNGELFCEACRFNFIETYKIEAIECHHTKPLNKGARDTELSDLILLCPNCHRVVHKDKNKVLTLNQLKKIIS